MSDRVIVDRCSRSERDSLCREIAHWLVSYARLKRQVELRDMIDRPEAQERREAAHNGDERR